MATPNPTLVELLSVAFQHEYFGGAFTDYSLAPSPSTAASAASLGLSFLRQGNAFSVYLRSGTVPAPVLLASLTRTALAWCLTPAQRTFASFTDLPALAPGSAVVLAVATGRRGGSFPLTRGATIGATEVRPLNGLRFDFRPTSPIAGAASVNLCDVAGRTLAAIPLSNPSLVPVDVSAWGPGLYSLSANNRALYTWFSHDFPSPLPLSSAALWIPGSVLAEAAAQAISAPAGGTTAAPAYSATYGARAVNWRYNIFNVPPESAASLSIVAKAGAAAASFVPVTGITGPGNATSRSFETLQPIKLASDAPQQFQLRSGGTVIVDTLPTAGSDLVRSSRGGGLCSEIFVYL